MSDQGMPSWMTGSLLLLAFCGAIVPGVRYHGTAGLEALEAWQTGVLTGVLGVVVVWLIRTVVIASPPAIPREFHPWLAIAVVAAAVKMVLPFEPSMWFLAAGCLRKGSMWAALALVMFVVICRREMTPATGAALGAMAGLAGFAVSASFCAINEASHVLAGHMPLGPAFILAGGAIGFAWPRRRR